MARTLAPRVVTANDLIEGDSVFLGPNGWVRDIRAARIGHSEEDAAALEAEGLRAEHANLVVGPYLVDVSLDGGAPWPLLRREQIRAEGVPTIPVGPEAFREVGRQAA